MELEIHLQWISSHGEIIGVETMRIKLHMCELHNAVELADNLYGYSQEVAQVRILDDNDKELYAVPD